MAKLYVTEFDDEGQTVRGAAQVAQVDANTVDQTPVAISGTSAQSAAFAATTVLVRIETDVICSVTFGTNPTATTNNMRMAADGVEYFGVPKGQSYKVAVISNT
ncbi:hypothetical protein CO683_00805 [Bradyrhizobium ottawaense]|uniref:hypothetical protein n=1 Tax=Bradyrhizobium ottawaense TaxID=931866 RepID=UPI000BE92F76|nr:hypothetical protein [Bradyrhizobium ottawaense]PDT71731.1 hypothetical protein CO683_00805 [Bradyrhizobium ottawaense]